MTDYKAKTKLGAVLAALRTRIVASGQTRPAAELLRDLQRARGEA